MSPGDCASTCIKAGDSEIKEGLRVEEGTGESLGGTLLWLLGMLWERREPRPGCS